MKVKSIKKIGLCETYDLTIKDDSNYLVGGQVVHNCLKDVSRILGVPYADVNAVTNSIIERSSGDERASSTIEDSFREFKVCREFNKKYPDVLKYAAKLEGMSKNLGIHAAGVVTSPTPLADITPLEVRKHDGEDIVVSAVDMYGVQAHGLLKLDVLGLRTLTVLKDAVRAIKEYHGIEVDLEALGLNDEKTLKGFTDHNYVGIFQYDSPGADKICSGVTFENFEDIAAMTALNRPGTARSGLATQFVARKKDPSKRDEGFLHPKVSEITADTLGIIVYQEHVLRIFTEIAGFAPATADSLRKKIAKKWGDETIGRERKNFIEGAKKTVGMDAKTAGKLMDAITFFGCLSKDTAILTPDGWKRIDALKDGDTILSCDGEKKVINTIKTVGSSGVKELWEIKTNIGTVRASADHWWQLSDGRYVKTKELDVGNKLSYPMSLKAIGGKNGKSLQSARVRKGSVGKRPVFSVLPEAISKRKNRARHSDRLSTHNNGHQGQGVEKGVGQIASFDSCAIRSDKRLQQSCLGGWRLCRIQSDENKVVKRSVPMSAMRQRADRESRCSQYESFACASQRSESKKQRFGKFISIVPILPFQGTYARKNKRRICGSVIQSITKVGRGTTWDLECNGDPHNYITNVGVAHNSYGFNKSHATAYGIIAYWGMWLKTYYPLEFYWALLKNEPTRIRIQQFAKDAKRFGIELLPPDVSISKKEFAIDSKRGAIRGSLVDIKNVGEAASASIMDNQPYADMFDFLDRVERRKVHKGVVLALVKAGALDDYIPNVKWMVENIEEWWKKLGSKKEEARDEAKRMLLESASQEDYASEERQLVAGQVNPLAFGKHPVDAYGDFLDKYVKVPLVEMSHENFWDDHHDNGVFIAGVVVEVKYNQVGDFHTGELPSEKNREKMFWGARYANVNVEDVGGKQNRMKFGIDIFDDMRELIDSGVGTPVIVFAKPNKRFENLTAMYAIDIEVLRKKIESGGQLSIWEKIVAGRHPAKRNWKATKKLDAKKVRARRVKNKRFFSGKSSHFTGVVTHVMLKYDKNDNKMAFFGMIDGAGNYVDCISFSSSWTPEVEKVIKSGRLFTIELDRQKDSRNNKKWQYFFNGGLIHWYKKSSA